MPQTRESAQPAVEAELPQPAVEAELPQPALIPELQALVVRPGAVWPELAQRVQPRVPLLPPARLVLQRQRFQQEWVARLL